MTRKRPGTKPFAWGLRYRTTPWVSIRQTGWDTFLAEAVCWGGIQLTIDPTSVKVLTWFTEPRTAEDAYVELKPHIGVTRAELASALTAMLEAGLLGVEGVMHKRLVPKVTTKVRLGRPLDGGYVVPAEFTTMVDGLAAFGVGDDLSFENAFCDRHPGKVLAFDHTIGASPYRRSRVELVRKGVAPKASAQMVSLNEVILAGPFERPMIKMDIEGAEWPILAACSDQVYQRVPIMVFELHGMLANTPVQDRVLTRLLEHHEPVHVHANNFGPTVKVDGHVYPEWLEVTFLHRRLLPTPVADRGPFPTPYDYPNSGDDAEIKLGWWR